MLNILALSLNLLVNDNIVITVKLKFIIFTWIGSFIILQLCFTPKEKDGTVLLYYCVMILLTMLDDDNLGSNIFLLIPLFYLY